MAVAKGPNVKQRRRAVAKKALLPRERLAELRKRSKLSVREVVQRLGYQSPSGYHRYEREDLQKDQPIPLDIVRRLMPHFIGRGQPPITADEMMALTDVQAAFSKGVVARYFTPQTVEISEGSGLVVRHLIEPGKFVKADALVNSGSRSMICAHALYGNKEQFVTGVRGTIGAWYASGDQLHCIDPSEFSPMSMRERKVVVAAPYQGSDLAAIVVAIVQKDDTLLSHDGEKVEGTVLGVIIGVYRQE